MDERTGREIAELLRAGESLNLFLYTPFCGTCTLAERMLGIILQMAPEINIVKCNVNLTPELCREWKIASVPCLLRIEKGQPAEKLYRMQSVDALYEWLNKNMRMKGDQDHERI